MARRTSQRALRRPEGRAVLLWVVGTVLCGLIGGCYEQKQEAVLNPDGSGKVLIETDVAVPAVGAEMKDKPTALTFGRLLAAELINKTRGVDAWSDVAVIEGAGGRAHISAVAYFPDINKLQFDMPLEFVWRRDLEGATLTLQRTKQSVASVTTLTPAELKELVGKAQAEYKETQASLRIQLTAFKLKMTFDLPGEVSEPHVFTQEGQSVSMSLDGKKIAEALDKFMADDKALGEMIKAGRDLAANDDYILESMMGQKGPVTAKVKMAADPKPVFDYRTEMRVAELKQADMFKEAGVELVPRFIVKPSPTAPATQGK